MIVVAGDLAPGSPASRVAEAIARAGEVVEAVGVVAPDAAGDRRLLALASEGVRHAAVLRSAADGLDAADLELALRYLPDIGAIVLADGGPGLVPVAEAAAAYAGAGLVLLADSDVENGTGGPTAGGTADRTIAIRPPARDPDGAFAGFVAALAIGLAAGMTPAGAWTDAASRLGVDPVSAGPS